MSEQNKKEKENKKDKISCKNNCEEELETIKEKYQIVKEKYNLPDFETMNEEFDISKIECDTETILRDTRKLIINKISSWLSFIETLLNPSGGSMFHMYLVKSINGDEKKTLNKLFSEIGEIEIEAIRLEISYDEEGEVKFIKDSYKKWKEMQKPLSEIINSLKNNWKKETVKKEKSYFG